MGLTHVGSQASIYSSMNNYFYHWPGNSKTYSLDLQDQYEYMELTQQFRFTPPTHTLLAFRTALKGYIDEGGLFARYCK